ncbi:hypothetical protein LOTGIDRAFT_209317 [Lottia gigantea]|uniref:Mitochondrial ornithine transporter 1 n=1 Tax=Lottia gigantea TaxID=225164 RepID=V4AJM7_LOTGI|nr:hypothetical protein LOTGIDRAFT_209317 [Lottia gigantea]ESO93776.1 hypothetical protein LOTGIDRAFT_209317 [Lottia gigantea]
MEQPLDLVEARAISKKEISSRPTAVDAAIDLTGGTAGGFATVVVGQPLDTVKVKLQTFPTLYRNAFHCFKQTYAQDGLFHGLYAGTVPSMAANIAENAVLFCFYGMCQKLVATARQKHDIKDLNPLDNAFAGCGAAFFSSFALCPTELIKCRLQAMREMATQGQYKGDLSRLKMGPWGLTREILHKEGISGLYKGLTSTFLREMPGYFVFFGGYEISKVLLTPKDGDKENIGILRTIICGGVGGASLWIVIFPADVVKSRIQIQSAGGGITPTFTSTILHIFRTEGIAALYNGLGPTLVRTFPATGALFLAYETTKKYLSRFYDGTFG